MSGRCKCGGIVYAGVNGPQYRKDNAREVAALIRKGFAIETASLEVARQGKWCTDSKEHMRE